MEISRRDRVVDWNCMNVHCWCYNDAVHCRRGVKIMHTYIFPLLRIFRIAEFSKYLWANGILAAWSSIETLLCAFTRTLKDYWPQWRAYTRDSMPEPFLYEAPAPAPNPLLILSTAKTFTQRQQWKNYCEHVRVTSEQKFNQLSLKSFLEKLASFQSHLNESSAHEVCTRCIQIALYKDVFFAL